MSEKIKINEEELRSILDLRERIRSNVETIGRLSIKKHFVELELNQVSNDLRESYSVSEDLNAEELRVVGEITSKYGEGNLDFSTGEYTPN